MKPKATMADYRGRLNKAYKAPPPKKGKLPQVVPKIDTGTQVNAEYKALMDKYKNDLAKQRDAAAQLFNRNKGMLDADRNITRESLTKSRGSDLEDIAQGYAARGIGRTSGVLKQAGLDYETNVNERLKNLDKTYEAQLKNQNETQNAAVGEATDTYTENMTEAATRKAAALEAEKKKTVPQAKKLPQAAPNKQPKLKDNTTKGLR